jgi:hypothetical protein
VVADTQASCGIMPFTSDFVGPLQLTIPFIHGLNGKAEVKGFGMAKWSVKDDATGNATNLLAPAYHVPLAKIRLSSPQQYFQHAGGGSLYADKDMCCITTATGAMLIIPFFSNNMPSFHLHAPVGMMANVASALDNDAKLLSPDNMNLSAPNKSYSPGTTLWLISASSG